MKKATKRRDDAVVFLSFESEFISFGGLGAVMKLLPNELGPSACAIMAPLFRKLVNFEELKRKGAVTKVASLFTQHILVRGESYPVEVIEVVNAKGLRTFYLGSDRFFQAGGNPYVNPCDGAAPLDPYRNPIDGDALTEDALFFCIAAPLVLAELAKGGHLPGRDVVLHLQDWETAAVALAVREANIHPALADVRCVLTVHNPYDKPLHARNSRLVCDLATHLGLGLRRSILEQVIPLLDAPVATVSSHFAYELVNEPLYTQIFCPHLQRAFKRRGLVGVDNGCFGPAVFPFSAKARRDAAAGNLKTLRAEKWKQRAGLAAVVNEYVDRAKREGKTVWGGPLKLDDPAVPVYFMLGRDDPRQKGFDVIVEAIKAIPRGTARYIFAVMPGDEGLPGLRFLQKLAAQRPDEVCVFPFRVEKAVFSALQKGCSFLVMGSMYEPFGAANEGYLAGMPVIARATGGLVQQVVPHPDCLRDEAVLGLYGQLVVRKYHEEGAPPTGILFREQVSFVEEVEGWREIVDCGYWERNPKGDRVAGRKDVLLFRRMVRSAAGAFRLAATVYRDQAQYAAMIYQGWKILPRFSWSRAVTLYRKRLYAPQPPLPPEEREVSTAGRPATRSRPGRR